jgi:UDP:flavonoid glycosyltransferase YjiC (YdhE family)
MHILFSSMPYLGHFYPLVPLARCLAERHEVQVASARSFGPEIIRANLRPVSAGVDGADALQLLSAQFPDEPIRALERKRRVLSTDVAVPRMAEDLLRLSRESRPDLLIHEEGELAAPIVSRVTGIPCVTVGWAAPQMSLDRARRLRKALVPLRGAEVEGCCPFSEIFGNLLLDTCPPSLRTSVDGVSIPRWPMRPSVYDGGGRVPEWLRALGSTVRRRPLVYVTFGTVRAFNRLPGEMSSLLDAIEREPVDLIVTVGRNNDPALLGRRAPNVRIEQYIPQTRLLPYVDAVVTHGGVGTTIAALSHGLPLMILPRGANSQSRLAAACEAAGAAIVPKSNDPAEIRRGLHAVMRSDRHRRAARQIAHEVTILPGSSGVAEKLESMAT